MLDGTGFAYVAEIEVIQWALGVLTLFVVWYGKKFINTTEAAIKSLRDGINECKETHRKDLKACQMEHVHTDLCDARMDPIKGQLKALRGKE